MMLRRLVVPARALIAVALVFFGSEVQTLAGDQPTSFTMPNGLRVRLVPIRGEKGVAVLFGVRAGFFEEPSGSPHLAHVTEHLVVFASPTQATRGRRSHAGMARGRRTPRPSPASCTSTCTSSRMSWTRHFASRPPG